MAVFPFPLCCLQKAMEEEEEEEEEVIPCMCSSAPQPSKVGK